MQNGEPNVYAALVTMRNTYLQMQWARVQMFLVFNAVGLPFVFGTTDGFEVVRAIVSVIGATVHLGFLVASERAEQWISFYDEKLAQLEEVDSQTEQLSVRTRVFSDQRFRTWRDSNSASRKLFSPLGVVVWLVWLWKATYSVLMLTVP